MSRLAALLAQPEPLLRRLRQSTAEPRNITRWSAQLAAGSGGGGDIEGVEALQRRVAAALDAGAALRPREIREACQVYFEPPLPPARNADTAAKLLQRVRDLKRRSPLLRLIDVYLDRFDADDADLVRLAGELDAMCPEWPWRPGAPWPERAKSFALFDPEAAPWRIATAVLESDQAIAKVLTSVGLDTELRRKGGLAAAAFQRACDTCLTLSGHPAQPIQERLIEWARFSGNALAYPGAWPDYANALFAPFRAKEPQEDHRTALIEAATAYAGDPRVSEAKWRQIKETHPDAYGVIMRWLTRASVEQFFEIVSETMRDRPDMWAERRAFWTPYLTRGHITKAWVAFGADGAWRAERAARDTNDPSLRMFGRIMPGGGRSPEHAALIMEIGSLTIVDWSHKGAWNIWPQGSRRIPVFFRHNNRGSYDYSPLDLMNGPIHGPHMGNWQLKLSMLIHDHTGIRPR